MKTSLDPKNKPTVAGLLAALAGFGLGLGMPGMKGPRAKEENPRKCILRECSSIVKGNQPACCREHFIEHRRRERFAQGVK